ncbi:hypothetical protein [Natrinema salifodinae]|uniref:Uncharacterized protein n=1 Tax=Natrinema salifodinae TaxID=1202768 RepID=A0A1I0QET4_9EURY|nr:hypothetical protein [Natrinema salifodinae]SEW25418.1 hypothetical protein SAMN05216285_3453 [Natrinema salifodinae]
MVADQDPIPPEALPPRWGLAELRDDRFIYRHSRPTIELIADSTLADRSHPGLGLCRCWELRYRYFLADRAIHRTIGRVSTRRAAVDGVLECMRCIHETVSTADDPLAVDEVLDTVSLSDFVPEGIQSPGST